MVVIDLTTAQVIGAVICVIGLMAGSYCVGFGAGREHAAKVELVELERISEEKGKENERLD